MMAAGAAGQLRFHVRDGAGNIIWPALTRIGDGPYYKFEDAKGGTLHEKTVPLSLLTFVADWFVPPYDPGELLSDSEADTNKSDERLTEIHTFKSSAEMNRAIRQQAATEKLEKSSWIRQAIGKQLSDAKGRKEIYPGASAALKELAERFADIQRCADELESGDLSLFLRSFRALLICLLDGNDVRQTHEDQRAFWHKIGAEVSRLRRDQSLGAALPIMLSSIVSDLNTVGRNLRAQGL